MPINTLNHKIFFYLSFIFLFFIYACTSIKKSNNTQAEDILNENKNDSNFLSYIVNPKSQTLKFYLKNKNGVPYSNFYNLKSELDTDSTQLIFAMNGGMYLKDQSPQGLYIENSIKKSELDTTQNAYGNFYMQPNGVFYLTNNNKPIICTSTNYKHNANIKYATQSRPMLLIDSEMHPRFIKGSSSLHIRNGVGILSDGNILFAMSKTEINFYDFATFFRENGCKNALYLDGFVSRTYYPLKTGNNWMEILGL